MAIIQKSFSDLVDLTRGSEATGWVNGQLETFGIDEPRFVTDPSTGYSGLLLEPFASTNLVHNSLRPLEWGWSSNWDVTPLQNIDGTMTAVRAEATAQTVFNVQFQYPRSGGHTITQITRPDYGGGTSGWRIAGLLRNNTKAINGGVGTANVETGELTGSCVSLTPLADGWYETVFVYEEEDIPGPPEAGDNMRWYVNDSSAPMGLVREIAGVQIETGTKATSFIPTGDSQVTRAADSDVVLHGQSFKDVFNPHSGALIIDVMSRHTTGTGNRAKVFGFGDGDYNNTAGNSIYLSQNHDGRYTLRRGSASLGPQLSLSQRIRLGFRWRDGVLGIFVDGARLTDSVDISDIDMNKFTELTFGGDGYPSAFSTAIFRNFQLYSGHLSDAQLAALTEL